MADLLRPVSGIDEARTFPVWVSEEEYLRVYAEQFYEYEEGKLVKLSPAQPRHTRMTIYLFNIIDEYFEANPVGEAFAAPFPLRFSPSGRRFREPDVLVILNTHRQHYYGSYTTYANICMEIISPESRKRDTTIKFNEYQKLGVSEYWLFDSDPNGDEPIFYRLDHSGQYQLVTPQGENYTTPLLPGFKLYLPYFTQERVPTAGRVRGIIDDMLNTPDTTPNPPSET